MPRRRRAARQHAEAVSQHRRFVGNMQQRLLADADIEAMCSEGQGCCVGTHHRDAVVKPDTLRQARGPQRTPGVQLQRRDGATALIGQVARRPAQSRAHIEHPIVRADGGLIGQGIDRRQPRRAPRGTPHRSLRK